MVRARRVRARFRGLRRDDRGITTLEVLIMFPILVICMFMSIQVAMDYYAKEVALGAAEAGTHAARLTGNPQDGVAAAKQYLHDHGGWLIIDDANGIDVSQSTPNQIVVTVSGSPPPVLGFLTHLVTVHETSVGPVEKFQTVGDQP